MLLILIGSNVQVFFVCVFLLHFTCIYYSKPFIWKILRVLASKCVESQASKFRHTSHGGGLTTTEQTQAADEGKFVGVGSQVTELSGNLMSDIDLTLWQPWSDCKRLADPLTIHTCLWNAIICGWPYPSEEETQLFFLCIKVG